MLRCSIGAGYDPVATVADDKHSAINCRYRLDTYVWCAHAPAGRLQHVQELLLEAHLTCQAALQVGGYALCLADA